MPQVKIINNNNTNLSKSIDYEFSDESIVDIIAKYDCKIKRSTSNISIGCDIIQNWDIPISAGLHYGEFISIFNYLVKLKLKFGDVEKKISVDLRDSISSIKKKASELFNLKVNHLQLKLNDKILHYGQLVEYDLQDDTVINIEEKAIKSELHICVRNISGTRVQIMATRDTTINELKYMIEEQEGRPLHGQIRLLYAGIQLEHDKTLAYYGIENGSTLQMVVRCVGGSGGFAFDFADVETKPSVIQWAKSGPKWRDASFGLCLEGECVNEKCVAFNQLVIMNMGVPIIYQIGITKDKPTNCPMCNYYVSPLTCAFNNCEWRYIGNKETPTGIQKMKSDWKMVGNEYHRFDEQKKCKWFSLTLEIRRSADCKDNMTALPCCSICLQQETKRVEFIKCVKCKSEMHVTCLSKWENHQIACPSCLYNTGGA